MELSTVTHQNGDLINDKQALLRENEGLKSSCAQRRPEDEGFRQLVRTQLEGLWQELCGAARWTQQDDGNAQLVDDLMRALKASHDDYSALALEYEKFSVRPTSA
jgi:hypothetical protein